MWSRCYLVFVDSSVCLYPGSGLTVSRGSKPTLVVLYRWTSFPVLHNGRKSLSENNGDIICTRSSNIYPGGQLPEPWAWRDRQSISAFESPQLGAWQPVLGSAWGRQAGKGQCHGMWGTESHLERATAAGEREFCIHVHLQFITFLLKCCTQWTARKSICLPGGQEQLELSVRECRAGIFVGWVSTRAQQHPASPVGLFSLAKLQ